MNDYQTKARKAWLKQMQRRPIDAIREHASELVLYAVIALVVVVMLLTELARL